MPDEHDPDYPVLNVYLQPPPPGTVRLKLVSYGTWNGTSVIAVDNAGNESPVTGIQSVHIAMRAGRSNACTVELLDLEAAVESEFKAEPAEEQRQGDALDAQDAWLAKMWRPAKSRL